jgi:hypothetical protein
MCYLTPPLLWPYHRFAVGSRVKHVLWDMEDCAMSPTAVPQESYTLCCSLAIVEEQRRIICYQDQLIEDLQPGAKLPVDTC